MLKDNEIGLAMRRAFEKHADGNEVKMLLAVAVRMNDKKICTAPNKVFAQIMGDKEGAVSERSISGWLAGLKEKRLINIVQNKHRHERWIYIRGIETAKFQVEPRWEDMTEAQRKFKQHFPNRLIDCDVPDDVDMDALLAKIEKDPNLRMFDNMSLYSCCIKHYKSIMSGGWGRGRTVTSNFSTGRNYSGEELNSLFQNVDEIEI